MNTMSLAGRLMHGSPRAGPLVEVHGWREAALNTPLCSHGPAGERCVQGISPGVVQSMKRYETSEPEALCMTWRRVFKFLENSDS